MLTVKRKMEIMEALVKANLTAKERELIFEFDKFEKGEKVRVIENGYAGRGWSYSKYLVGNVLSKVLGLEIQNDAPIGGHNGDFVLLATKKTVQEVEYLRTLIISLYK